MEMVMPSIFIEMKDEEMMYVDGGGIVQKAVFDGVSSGRMTIPIGINIPLVSWVRTIQIQMFKKIKLSNCVILIINSLNLLYKILGPNYDYSSPIIGFTFSFLIVRKVYIYHTQIVK